MQKKVMNPVVILIAPDIGNVLANIKTDFFSQYIYNSSAVVSQKALRRLAIVYINGHLIKNSNMIHRIDNIPKPHNTTPYLSICVRHIKI